VLFLIEYNYNNNMQMCADCGFSIFSSDNNIKEAVPL
jgi:hypothetical protein